MNPLYVTVGTSAVENADIGRGNRKVNERLRRDVADFLADADDYKEQSSTWAILKDDLVTAHEAFWTLDERSIRNPDNYRQTSAELLSTYLLVAERKIDFDLIVLLCSQTAEGRFAAEINRRVFSGPAYRKRLPLLHAKVEVLEVRGLNESIVGAVGELRRILFDGSQEIVRVNMTGAYKGVAAVLGLLAGLETKKKLRLFYFHEKSEQPIVLMADHPPSQAPAPGVEAGFSGPLGDIF